MLSSFTLLWYFMFTAAELSAPSLIVAGAELIFNLLCVASSSRVLFAYVCKDTRKCCEMLNSCGSCDLVMALTFYRSLSVPLNRRSNGDANGLNRIYFA